MVSVLHITPHLGGGVGSVLLNWLTFEKENSQSNIHIIATLDYANTNACLTCKQYDISLHSDMSKNHRQLIELIKYSDITIIHFWNHPLLYEFLLKNALPECRLVFWAHVSGFNPPQVFPKKIIDMADKFIFTTPISYNVREVKMYPDKNKFDSILSTSGVEKFFNLPKKPHKGFNAGYIGTVDYAKMHKDFLKIVKNTNIPDIKFIVVGGDKQDELKQEAQKLKILDKMIITGKVSDIKPYLEEFDIFSYPLNPKHYGTAEQVLQEAMAAGVVPIVLNNPSECYLVRHSKTGLIANNIAEFCKYIRLLYCKPDLKIKLADNCKKYAKENFSISKLSEQWNTIFYKLKQNFPTPKQYSKKTDYSPHEIFLESLGCYKEPFVLYLQNKNTLQLSQLLNKSQWKSESKGTPKQYLKFMKDETLERIYNINEQK